MQDIEKLKKRINTAKTSIILVAVLTIANTILIAVNADMVFTFSAHVPQLVTFMFSEIAVEMQEKSYLYIGIAIAILMSLIYVALWLGAKKKNSFMVVALVLFSIDSAVLLYDLLLAFDASFIIDIAFHAWVIYDLILGISAYSKLKKIPAEELQQNVEQAEYYSPLPQNTDNSAVNQAYEPVDSAPIRISENKGRVIMSVDYQGMNVEVRRSKGLTELIVDGKVYAEKKGILETEYTIGARVSGVEFVTSMTMSSVMYLYADGAQIAKKLRMI
ncbi:MAG: hypothetical protein K2K01_03010 [Eubacterium sp.]|nr:hypothetical protein [Eubacterium sp.]